MQMPRHPALQPDQVTNFKELAPTQPRVWQGKVPVVWANTLISDLGDKYQLSQSSIDRSGLRSMWKDCKISNEACFLSTMAWGGMRMSNGRDAWDARSKWLPICDDIRAGKYTRMDGFDAFRKLRVKNQLPGMGAAYFTKILFFATPSQDAYILDQWTARSMHILTNQRRWPSVQIDYLSAKRAAIEEKPQRLRVSVTDRVTASDYEYFCQLIKKLADSLSIHPHEAEERIFGIGGKTPSAWRAHVMDNWSSLPLS
ncbi:hypothetical protein [Methylobacter sp. BBA5.1]|uniref:8-oxoguanine DNA glycosylase OGG fold protein n=1 Tax=Methylobacter sp. BBA5.1 TaxID=1495064 RepID=UPI001267A197|nr:hypothetical protein [Methylobacter sp. BBA5.1]